MVSNHTKKQADLDRVLVTGGSGMIGSAVYFGMRPNPKELDICDKEGAASFMRARKPSAILHLAGLTDLRYCEEHPAEADRINRRGTEIMCGAAEAQGIPFIYLSTNAVFDGEKIAPYDEDDLPHPNIVYGASKRAGEEIVARLSTPWLIVRTGWVFGGGKERDKRFVGKIIQQLHSPFIRAFSDVSGTPTYARDLIARIISFLGEGRTGLIHVTNGNSASRYDQARVIAEFFKFKGEVVPISRETVDSVPPILKNEALVSKHLTLRSWQEALTEYLSTEW